MIIFYLLLWVISATAPKWISECVINGKSLQDRSTMNEVFICDRIKALSVDDFEQLFAALKVFNSSFTVSNFCSKLQTLRTTKTVRPAFHRVGIGPPQDDSSVEPMIFDVIFHETSAEDNEMAVRAMRDDLTDMSWNSRYLILSGSPCNTHITMFVNPLIGSLQVLIHKELMPPSYAGEFRRRVKALGGNQHKWLRHSTKSISVVWLIGIIETVQHYYLLQADRGQLNACRSSITTRCCWC
eukprot:GHVH01016387.1.p1 GENE.GHVH01016387.1~~GHVH01016387.1.p1  ORF type:complete len:241 (+),score=29.13 GHVH01016387.1:1497-2219(+)